VCVCVCVVGALAIAKIWPFNVDVGPVTSFKADLINVLTF